MVNWHPFGEKNGRWKGGINIDKDGYILVKKRDHPHCDPRGYVRQHRFVYEEYHKCCLLRCSVIHHKNGNKQDNRIENLQLISKKEHDRMEGNIRRDPNTGRFS